ncbi:archease [Amycolatopsis sp.]|uniref:archease n=1 Tax=Amycolatopsis sp. TaxID=37632 RepID=UPI002B5E99F4|nr:archease [Amycolatopsis sp.]HVV14536.1 archease [Amycolatopsis sp.]
MSSLEVAKPAGAARQPVHAADLHIRAWAPTRESCLAEAVTALTDSLVRVRFRAPATTFSREVRGDTDDELLAAVLGAVITNLRSRQEIPLSADVRATPDGLRLVCAVVDLGAILPAGPVPKGVSPGNAHCLRPGGGRWCCTARIDV